jgi:phenylacetate-CoA ligase
MPTINLPFALLVGGDGLSFGSEDLVCEYAEQSFCIPAEIAAQAEKMITERQRGLGFELTNEPSYRLSSFRFTPPNNGSNPQLHLRLQRTNYFDFIATNLSLDQPILRNKTSIRDHLIKNITQLEDSPLANPLSVMVLLLSESDGIAVLPRRSQHVAFDRGCRQISAGGAMRLAVDCDEELKPSVFLTAQRELAEELGIRLPVQSFRFLGLGVDTRTGEPELLGMASTGLSIEQIRQAYREAQHGNKEFVDAAFLLFEPGNLEHLMVDEEWCPGDWVGCWLALVYLFGAENVNSRIAWQSTYGVSLSKQETQPVSQRLAKQGQAFHLAEWRKGLPLTVRQFYGWVRRIKTVHWVWENPEFKQWYSRLLESQWWSKADLEAYQLQRLKEMLAHAYQNVPYYKEVFDSRNLKPSDFKSLEDLNRLPLLTKEDVRLHLRELVARNIDPSRLYYVMTGGTTGTPTGFYHEQGITTPHEDAFMYRQWHWAGYRFGDRVAKLRAVQISHNTWQGEPAFWDFITTENALLLSIFNLSETTIPHYIAKLQEFKPVIIQGYPSGLEMLAGYMLSHDLHNPNPRAVLTEFEALYPSQRDLIQAAFQCPVMAGYGHTERAVDAVECEEQNGYHISMEYGILEITNERGEPVPEGESGYITGTGLDTYCMPFIRYQTDDLARISDFVCPCGRHMPMLVDIVGRWQHDVIVTADDRYIPITSMNVHSSAFSNVAQYQFAQERKGELILRVVRRPAYREADTGKIIQALQDKFRGGIEIQVVFVEEIPRTRRGKFRLLEQTIRNGLRTPQRGQEV